MRNKLTVLLVVMFLAVSFSVCAVWSSVADTTNPLVLHIVRPGSLVANTRGFSAFRTNPAGLKVADVKEGFTLNAWTLMDSDVKQLYFSPQNVVRGVCEDIQEIILANSFDAQSFWSRNTALITTFKEDIDAGFPTIDISSPLTIWEINSIQEYFATEFLSDGFTDALCAEVMLAFSRDSDFFSAEVADSRTILAGDSNLGMSFHAGNIRSGFGWGVSLLAEYSTINSLLSPGQGKLSIAFEAPIGFAFEAGDRLSFGLSMVNQVLVNTKLPHLNILEASLKGPLLLLLSEPFSFGLGMDLAFGFLIRADEHITLGFALRHLPAIQWYRIVQLADLAGIFDTFPPPSIADETIYYVPTVIAAGISVTSTIWKIPVDWNLELSGTLRQFAKDGLRQDLTDMIKAAIHVGITGTTTVSLGYATDFLGLEFKQKTGFGTYSISGSLKVFDVIGGSSVGLHFAAAY